MKEHFPGHRNYRNPPKEHQFKKGRSGNPKGRPKKNPQTGFGALGGGIANRLGAVALDEATRLVTVQVGDKVSEITAMQALVRTLFKAAAQGDIRAARQLLELIGQAEIGRTRAALDALEQAVRYKEKYGPIFQERERQGEEPLDIYPTRTISSSIKTAVKSPLTALRARNRPAREKRFERKPFKPWRGISKWRRRSRKIPPTRRSRKKSRS